MLRGAEFENLQAQNENLHAQNDLSIVTGKTSSEKEAVDIQNQRLKDEND